MAGKRAKARRKQAARIVRFNAAKAVKLFTAGGHVTDIAVKFGYPRGHGQNRVRAALMKAGVYKPVRGKAALRNTGRGGKVAVMPQVSKPETMLREVYAVAESRYKKLTGRARTGWLEKLTGMLVAGMGEKKPVKVAPVQLPVELSVIRGGRAA